MPFDHNDHYHRLLSRHVPRGGGSALDVGCGTGRFARRLAAAGLTVDAIDPSQEAITEARARSGPGDGGPRFERADIREVELPTARYDLISCLASIHHLPFGTVTALREALAPGGVLLILGCYPERTRLDWAWSLAAVPVNALARLAVAAVDAGGPAPGTGYGRPWRRRPCRWTRSARRRPSCCPGRASAGSFSGATCSSSAPAAEPTAGPPGHPAGLQCRAARADFSAGPRAWTGGRGRR